MKRHVHMLDLDSPSHPRLRRSSCKDCVVREEENEKLRETVRKLIGDVNFLGKRLAEEDAELTRLHRSQSNIQKYVTQLEEERDHYFEELSVHTCGDMEDMSRAYDSLFRENKELRAALADQPTEEKLTPSQELMYAEDGYDPPTEEEA